GGMRSDRGGGPAVDLPHRPGCRAIPEGTRRPRARPLVADGTIDAAGRARSRDLPWQRAVASRDHDGLGRGDIIHRSTGSVNWNVAPCLGFGVAQSRPPWPSMIERLIDSPMPIPPGLVVKKALNSRST